MGTSRMTGQFEMSDDKLKEWLKKFIEADNRRHIRPNAILLAKRVREDIDRVMALLMNLRDQGVIKAKDGHEHQDSYCWPWEMTE